MIAAVLSQASAAQAPNDASAAQQDRINSLRRHWLSAFGTSAADRPGNIDTQAAAFIGREDLIRRPKDCATLPGEPIAQIVERARSTNIVIINEAHDSPRDRHFIGKLLEALKPEGYTTYAVEALVNDGRRFDHPDTRLSDGHYLGEPVFARTLELAKKLGYQLVAYEIRADQFRDDAPRADIIPIREQAQTDNLMAAIFRDRPDEKVVIHVGYMHALERSARAQGVKTQWMAERLAAATGRDPLTINQTDCGSASPSTAIVQGPNEGYDLFVGHPKSTFVDGRPDWRRAIGDIATPVPANLIPKDGAVIIEARLADETLDIVPTDRVLLRSSEYLPLLTPPGRYRLDAFTPEGPLNTAPVFVDVR